MSLPLRFGLKKSGFGKRGESPVPKNWIPVKGGIYTERIAIGDARGGDRGDGRQDGKEIPSPSSSKRSGEVRKFGRYSSGAMKVPDCFFGLGFSGRNEPGNGLPRMIRFRSSALSQALIRFDMAVATFARCSRFSPG